MNETMKLVDDMQSEMNASPAVAYACAACLLGLCLLALSGAGSTAWPEVVADPTQPQYVAIYDEEHY